MSDAERIALVVGVRIAAAALTGSGLSETDLRGILGERTSPG